MRRGGVWGRHHSEQGAGIVRSRRQSDRGSATVWSLGAMAVLCAVFGAVLALGQAVVVRHRAAGGADLAALAAAAHWEEGGAAACARAERVAAAQGVRLVRCTIVGETSDVTAASGRGPFAAEARARAGPAGPAPDASVPRGSVPRGSVPRGSVPSGSVSSGSMPGGPAPKAPVPGESAREAPVPGEPVPEAALIPETRVR